MAGEAGVGYRGNGTSKWEILQKAALYCDDQVCYAGDHGDPVPAVHGTSGQNSW